MAHATGESLAYIRKWADAQAVRRGQALAVLDLSSGRRRELPAMHVVILGVQLLVPLLQTHCRPTLVLQSHAI
jgi:hypothetical protein